MEVWENEKLKWEHETVGRVFPRYFEFSQVFTNVSVNLAQVLRHQDC